MKVSTKLISYLEPIASSKIASLYQVHSEMWDSKTMTIAWATAYMLPNMIHPMIDLVTFGVLKDYMSLEEIKMTMDCGTEMPGHDTCHLYVHDVTSNASTCLGPRNQSGQLMAVMIGLKLNTSRGGYMCVRDKQENINNYAAGERQLGGNILWWDPGWRENIEWGNASLVEILRLHHESTSLTGYGWACCASPVNKGCGQLVSQTGGDGFQMAFGLLYSLIFVRFCGLLLSHATQKTKHFTAENAPSFTQKGVLTFKAIWGIYKKEDKEEGADDEDNNPAGDRVTIDEISKTIENFKGTDEISKTFLIREIRVSVKKSIERYFSGFAAPDPPFYTPLATTDEDEDISLTTSRLRSVSKRSCCSLSKSTQQKIVPVTDEQSSAGQTWNSRKVGKAVIGEETAATEATTLTLEKAEEVVESAKNKDQAYAKALVTIDEDKTTHAVVKSVRTENTDDKATHLLVKSMRCFLCQFSPSIRTAAGKEKLYQEFIRETKLKTIFWSSKLKTNTLVGIAKPTTGFGPNTKKSFMEGLDCLTKFEQSSASILPMFHSCVFPSFSSIAPVVSCCLPSFTWLLHFKLAESPGMWIAWVFLVSLPFFLYGASLTMSCYFTTTREQRLLDFFPDLEAATSTWKLSLLASYWGLVFVGIALISLVFQAVQWMFRIVLTEKRREWKEVEEAAMKEARNAGQGEKEVQAAGRRASKQWDSAQSRKSTWLSAELAAKASAELAAMASDELAAMANADHEAKNAAPSAAEERTIRPTVPMAHAKGRKNLQRALKKATLFTYKRRKSLQKATTPCFHQMWLQIHKTRVSGTGQQMNPVVWFNNAVQVYTGLYRANPELIKEAAAEHIKNYPAHPVSVVLRLSKNGKHIPLLATLVYTEVALIAFLLVTGFGGYAAGFILTNISNFVGILTMASWYIAGVFMVVISFYRIFVSLHRFKQFVMRNADTGASTVPLAMWPLGFREVSEYEFSCPEVFFGNERKKQAYHDPLPASFKDQSDKEEKEKRERSATPASPVAERHLCSDGRHTILRVGPGLTHIQGDFMLRQGQADFSVSKWDSSAKKSLPQGQQDGLIWAFGWTTGSVHGLLCNTRKGIAFYTGAGKGIPHYQLATNEVDRPGWLFLDAASNEHEVFRVKNQGRLQKIVARAVVDEQGRASVQFLAVKESVRSAGDQPQTDIATNLDHRTFLVPQNASTDEKLRKDALYEKTIYLGPGPCTPIFLGRIRHSNEPKNEFTFLLECKQTKQKKRGWHPAAPATAREDAGDGDDGDGDGDGGDGGDGGGGGGGDGGGDGGDGDGDGDGGDGGGGDGGDDGDDGGGDDGDDDEIDVSGYLDGGDGDGDVDGEEQRHDDDVELEEEEEENRGEELEELGQVGGKSKDRAGIQRHLWLAELEFISRGMGKAASFMLLQNLLGLVTTYGVAFWLYYMLNSVLAVDIDGHLDANNLSNFVQKVLVPALAAIGLSVSLDDDFEQECYTSELKPHVGAIMKMRTQYQLLQYQLLAQRRPRRGFAATKIQAWFRGRHARKADERRRSAPQVALEVRVRVR
jgi:hypothetical protein